MTEVAIEKLISSLRADTSACPFAIWPGELAGLGSPGLYAWWGDSQAAEHISTRLGSKIEAGIIYAGQAGAGRSNATLASRIGGNHIKGKVRNSTFRLTVAAVLLEAISPYIRGDRDIGDEGERLLQAWLASHFRVTVVPFADRARLAGVEQQVLSRLDPPLNLLNMATSPARVELSRRRSLLRGRPEATRRISVGRRHRQIAVELSVSEPRTKAITLHEEIAQILLESSNRWQSTSEIAAEVNERGRYRKRDLSPVSPFQVHGRTRNYSELFERDGSRVRLRLT